MVKNCHQWHVVTKHKENYLKVAFNHVFFFEETCLGSEVHLGKYFYVTLLLGTQRELGVRAQKMKNVSKKVKVK